jgi:signal transduction histidine kinase
VAHDLRNPVSAVKMLSHALLSSDGSVVSDAAREQLQLIRDAAQQMDHLIRDLLDITRVEMGRLMVNPQPTTTLALLEGALGTLRPLVEQAGIKLAIEVPAVLPRVKADPERIGQVFSNLIGNSIKFTARGGHITVAAAARGDEVVVSVTDTGSGIAEEELAHIFDRYWQSSSSAIRSRGAGLGLPIARGIIIAHGGRMWAESRVGHGSTFHFSLPVAE